MLPSLTREGALAAFHAPSAITSSRSKIVVWRDEEIEAPLASQAMINGQVQGVETLGSRDQPLTKCDNSSMVIRQIMQTGPT